MKKTLTIFLLFLIAVFIVGSEKPRTNGDRPNNNQTTNSLSQTQLSANNINTWYRNNGSYNRNPTSGNSGFEWPKGSNKFARYASGLWLGAKISGQTRIVVAEYDYEYLSGATDNNGNPFGKDDPNYRVYVISSPTDPDYGVWPFEQGAPKDINGQPLILGATTMFYAYTDSYAEAHGNRAGSTLPLGADIQQLNWAYTLSGPLSDMVFQRFRVINRSSNTWDSAFVSLWTDDDIGGNPNADLVGCDINRSLGYTYKGITTDPLYSTPPAVGFDFFQGPLVDSPGDTAKIPDLATGTIIVIPNKRVLGMSSFNKYTNGNPNFGDPANYIETYNYMRGKTKTGAEYIDPTSNLPTSYVHPGDPELDSGWVDSDFGDRRFMMTTGPFTMSPGDTQDIVTVQLITTGTSNLNSVTKLKTVSDVAQKIYDNAFQAPSAFPAPTVTPFAPGDGKIYLAWNDTPETTFVANKLSGGRYEFEGYQVFAIKPGKTGEAAEDRIMLAQYDKVNGRTDLKDSVIDNYGFVVWTTVILGTNSGISRYLVIDRDPITQNTFVNGTPYRFAVISFAYDSLANIERGSLKINTSNIPNSITTVIPQALTQGTVYNYGVGDTVFVSNRRDLGILPLVISPLHLTGGNYRTTYSSVNGLSWTLTKDGTTIISNYPDFSGVMDTALTVDGMLMVHQNVRDSGIVKDANDTLTTKKTKYGGWQYNPPQNQWIEGVRPSAITNSTKLFPSSRFHSVQMGMSFPTAGTFRNLNTKVKANGTQFTPVNGILNGGPLRKMKIVFGQTQKAYRYSPGSNVLLTDTALLSTPYVDYVDIPFSAYAIDELDSSGGTPRQLNVAFVDTDNNGVWDPDTTGLGKYQLTYFLASTYDPNVNNVYTTRNVGSASPITGFGSIDIMYVWAPRVKTVNGAPMTYQNGDELIIYPYTITRADFVPGFAIYYNFSVDPSLIGNNSVAQSRADMDRVNVFPNPYYGGHRLEPSAFNRFVYFSNLPSSCTIYIYSLNGELIRQINRSNNDPNNSLEQWNLQNSEGVSVASGMYIAYIDAPGIGTKILKLAILTPEERIRRF